MDDLSGRSSLCARCGAVLAAPELAPGEQRDGACPDCGLGFTSTLMAADRPSRSRLGRWWAGRRSRRLLEAHDARRSQVLRRRAFPIYGLDNRWTGRRWAGGWSASGDRVHQIDLGHGDVYDEKAALVRVETTVLGPDGKWRQAQVARELAEHLWRTGGDHAAVRRTITDPEPTAGWADLILTMDGEPLVFRSLHAGPAWVALGRLDDALVAATARNVDPTGVGLVPVIDVEPYLVDGGVP